jgi:hypothetical protein
MVFFACQYLLIYGFILILVLLRMGFGPHWSNLFGKKDEMRGHMLEVELNYLDPKIFDNIQDLFMKFKSLLLNLKGCGVDKSTQEK